MPGIRTKKQSRISFYCSLWNSDPLVKLLLIWFQVVCYALGFTSVVKVYQSFGPGTGRVWLHNLRCYGNETSLTQCGHGRWGSSPCSHDEDVGLICGGNYSMVTMEYY